MSFTDFAQIDRAVQRMAKALLARERAARDAADEDALSIAFVRDVSSKDAYRMLGELAIDPLATALRAWVGALTIERVTSEDWVRLARARALPVTVDGANEADLSVRERVKMLLGAERDARPQANRIHRAGGGVLEALGRYAERRAEAVRLLAGDGVALDDWPSDAAVVTRAIDLALRGTQAAFDSEPIRGGWLDVLRSSLAIDAGEGWPAKLTPRWLLSLFDRGELLRGVQLDPGALPEALGAASFARALAQLGAAWARADRPSNAPMSLLRTPRDGLVARRAALFASLLLEPAFHEKKLGLGRDRSRQQVRAIGRAALVWIRAEALRASAWRLVRTPAGPRDFEELSERALGRPMPSGLFGVVPRLDPASGATLIGMLEALAEREMLRERFDDDWFDNPRAHDALRHDNHQLVAERPVIDPDRVERALDARIHDVFGAG